MKLNKSRARRSATTLALSALFTAVLTSPAFAQGEEVGCDFVRDCEPVPGIRFENCTPADVSARIDPSKGKLIFSGRRFALTHFQTKEDGSLNYLASRGNSEVLVSYDSTGATLIYWKDKHEDFSSMHYGRCRETK